MGKGRFAVMEQQPGPVNWADFNAQPLPGMVRLWAWEAIAHGAEFVSFFRFKQLPFAQEQMHAGLLRVDGEPAAAWQEVQRLSEEISRITLPPRRQAKVALVFDYESQWMTEIQPQAQSYNALEISFRWYSALRRLGVDVDIISPQAKNLDYRMILIPSALCLDDPGYERILECQSQLIVGPRSGSKTTSLQVPAGLPPGPLQKRLPLKVRAVDSIRDASSIGVAVDAEEFSVSRWLEDIESNLTPLYRTSDGRGVAYENENILYLNAWVADDMLLQLLQKRCQRLDIINDVALSDVRLSHRGDLVIAVNYGPEQAHYAPSDAECLLGSEQLDAADIAIWKLNNE
ncbi:MAG: hypothetical protein DHS20C12_30630 [Pseudohongiella sp.]|nr:MAG: hypothetical protein DHS20C12_30630 [Pseudohongiella sp.]